jgi:endonuclease YncB( thermonuclease family)
MTRRMRRVLVISVAAWGAAVLVPGSASAAKGPCVAGKKRPICHFWTGRVTFVADGDTLDVNITGDGTSRSRRVRITGINAMEQTVYSINPKKRKGQCHSLQATSRLEALTLRRRVRLAAQRPSSRAGNRIRRSIAVKRDGRWTDVGQILVDEGHALWLPNKKEWARNANYSRGTQIAAAAGLRLWDTDYCRHGPHQSAELKMWVNWDADGSDRPRYRGEWAKIKNTSTSDIPVGGWWFRDSHHRLLRFPAGALIPARGTLTVVIGRRPRGDGNRATRFYWAQRKPVFDNAGSRRRLGDGGYLFDRHGDLRAWMMYPCRVACSDPLRGRISMSAHPGDPEKIFVRNTGTDSVDLEGYVVENYPYLYSLRAGATVDPGETLSLVVKGSPRNNSRLVRYWGKRRYILNDDGDRVLVRTHTNIRIACHAWGRRRC